MNALVTHQFNSATIDQRNSDGYLNATAMCKAAGKLWGHYIKNDGTQAYLSALSADIGIPISRLINSLRGGNGIQGTWVHPKVAIHLAQWLSPEFAVWCTNIIHDWMVGKTVPVKSHRRRQPGGKVLQKRINKFRQALLAIDFEAQSVFAFMDDIDNKTLRINRTAWWAFGDMRDELFDLTANARLALSLSDMDHLDHISATVLPKMGDSLDAALTNLDVVIDSPIKVVCSFYQMQSSLQNIQRILRRTPQIAQRSEEPIYVGDPAPVQIAG